MGRINRGGGDAGEPVRSPPRRRNIAPAIAQQSSNDPPTPHSDFWYYLTLSKIELRRAAID